MKASPPPRQAAYALVVVLSAVVLCALMIVILMERGVVGIKSASSYSQGMRVRALSDMVQNLVQAQIHDATTLNQKTGTPIASRDAWASQPGAIRVFSPSGTLREIFKLYSAPDLKTTNPDLAQDVSDLWYQSPSLYTDLNEPVRDNTVTPEEVYYPIMNPDAATLNSGATGIANGFSIAADAPVGSGSTANPAPMPVRWIYVLQDGTLCQLGDSRINRESNPIIGRIAFWADDETCKVNINTAAPVRPNSYWDAPRAVSNSETNTYAWAQPAQNEYQRYPGHPAMVSLRSILGNLGGMSDADYYALTPRYIWGGSQDGGVRVNQPRISLLRNKQDRAYASVDELLFRSLPQGASGTGRSQPTTSQVTSLGFFLTASSRAPELNLFGQPRVTIWPIHKEDSDIRRTPYDRLIAFCSTIGSKRYYFTREDAMSPTHDFTGIARNQELYEYLQDATNAPVPGFSSLATFHSKYGADRDQILTEIFDYIRITNLNETYANRDPNFVSFTSDWRITREGNPDVWDYSVNTTQDFPEGGSINGAGLVVPIEIGNTRGMGRFPAIAEAGLIFVNHAKRRPVTDSTGNVIVPEPPHEDNPEQLEAMLVMETITPAFGFLPWVGKDIYFEMASSDLRMRVGDREMDLFPASVQGKTTRPIHHPPLLRGGFSPGGYDGASYAAGADGLFISGNGANQRAWRFFSPPLDLQAGDTSFSIIGGTIIMNVLVGDTIIQTYTFNFGDANDLPLPVRSALDFNYNYLASGVPYGKPWWRARFQNSEYSGPFTTDVLHSIELAHGDARLVAGRKNVPADYFQPHADYAKPVRFAHGMRNTGSSNKGALWNGSSAGTYVDLPMSNNSLGVSGEYSGFRRTTQPKIPSSIVSLTDNWSGDFDNAWNSYLDGPFINKPDEGSQSRPGSTEIPYQSWRWVLANGLFSPLRQVPSAVMFGSLPTGVISGDPWQTLLFCANPADSGHKGFSAPADHLMLDLFRMPVVEPYAISGPGIHGWKNQHELRHCAV